MPNILLDKKKKRYPPDRMGSKKDIKILWKELGIVCPPSSKTEENIELAEVLFKMIVKI